MWSTQDPDRGNRIHISTDSRVINSPDYTLFLIQPVLCENNAVSRPLILIYSQNSQGYGEELGRIIEKDGRMDARILVISQADLFRSMLYFPYVKVVVTVFNHDRDKRLSTDLEDYYAEGGGIIGMGFAGWWTTTRNASRDVFSLAAGLCQFRNQPGDGGKS